MILPDDIDEKLEIWVGETDSEASDSESDLSDHETKSTRHHRHSHSHSRPHSGPLSRRHSNGRPASASAPELDSKRDLCHDAERKQRRSRTKDDGQVRRLVLGNGLEVKVGRRSAGQTHANGKGKGEGDNVFILRKQLEAVTANSNANANNEESRQRHPQYPPGLGLDLGLGLERGHNERTSLPPKKSHVKSETEHTHLHPHSQVHRQPYTHAHTHTHTHGHTYLHPHTQTHEKSTSTSTSLPLPRSRRPGPIGLGLDLLSNVARPSRLFTSKTRSSSSLRSQRDVTVSGTQAAQAAQVHIAAAATHNEEATIMSATSTSATVARVERRYSIESIDSSVRGSPRRSSSRVHVHVHVSDNDAAAIEGHEKNEKNGVSFSTGEIARETESEVPIGLTGGPGILQQVRAWAWQLWTPSPSSSSHL